MGYELVTLLAFRTFFDLFRASLGLYKLTRYLKSDVIHTANTNKVRLSITSLTDLELTLCPSVLIYSTMRN